MPGNRNPLIDTMGERLVETLFIYKQEIRRIPIDDIILSEYGTAVVGLRCFVLVNEESAEEKQEKEHIVQFHGISTLSFSE